MKLLQEEDNNWEQSKGKEREQQQREHRKRLGNITEGVKIRKRKQPALTKRRRTKKIEI